MAVRGGNAVRFEASLSANAPKWYAMGFRSPVKRSTRADANESRDWHIGSDLAFTRLAARCIPDRPATQRPNQLMVSSLLPGQ